MIAEDLPKYIGAVAKNINATAINPEKLNISNERPMHSNLMDLLQ